jgi:hypothetical protein
MNTKEEIIDKLEALTKEEINEEVFAHADELNNEYIRACDQRNHELLFKFIEEGGNANEFTAPKDNIDSRFNELIHILSDREKKFKKLQRDEIETKLAAKQEIVNNLEKLINEETNMGRAFQQFKEMQAKWTEIGNVPTRDYKHLQSAFHRHVHNFYYNLKLSKDLRELDFKRNLEFRNALLDKIESLLQVESIKGIEKLLNLYRLEWNDMGPTAPETIETLRTRYRELTGRVLQRIRDFYLEREQHEQEHLAAKRVLLERMQKIAEENFDTAKQWLNMFNTTQQIFDEWKKVGFASKVDNEKIWHEFRTAMNVFYKKKRDFFLNLKAENKNTKQKKNQLIEKAESIATASHESWDEPTEQIKDLQKEWKEAGHISKGDDDRLWKRFREACNKFFDAKNDAFKERNAELLKNLELKEELVKRITEFNPTGNADTDIESLKGFSNEWKNIQHVPFKDKERIYEKYKKALDAKYEALKVDKSKKHLLKYRNSVDMMKQGGSSGNLLRKEEQDVKHRISKLRSTIAQYENNLGFFANAKGMESLLKDAQDNLNRTKDELKLLEQKLKMLKETAQQA